MLSDKGCGGNQNVHFILNFSKIVLLMW